MTSSSPGTVKKDFGFQQGRLTLPPSCSSPGANYITASSSLPHATSTPVQREMLHYKINWRDKVRNVFRVKKKKKGGFTTDPDPQPFSRATGAMVHSTPKIFDQTTASVENLALHSSSEDDIPQSLLDDTLPGKAAHSDKQKQKGKPFKARKKDAASPGRKDGQQQTSVDDKDGLSNVNLLITEHNESTGHNSTLSPSNLSKSSIREQSTLSSTNNSSEDEEVSDQDRRKSPGTSDEWHGQQKKRKKSVQSMDQYSHRKICIERSLSAGNSTEVLNQEDEMIVRRQLTYNISDSLITDEHKRSKKKKPERIRGPHQSRENLGRPTILDSDIKSQQQSSVEDEDKVDFAAVLSTTPRLSTKAAHDKRGAAKNIKRRRATTKRSFFLHTEEEHGTSIVDPSANAESGKSSELQKVEQTVQHLRLRPQQSSSASIVAKAVEKRNSIDKSPVDDVMEQPADLIQTDSKRKFSMSTLINKQILESPLRAPVLLSPSPKPQHKEPKIFEQVKLKPINNSPVKSEQKLDTTSTTIIKEKTNIPPIKKEKPKRTVAPSPDKTQDLASPVKENRTNIPKLPVNLDTDTKMDTKEAAVSLPLKDTRLPLIVEPNRSKSRRAKTVAQPVKTIGYMKEAPNKPAWIEIAQQKTRRVSEALCSTDKLPQLSPSPAKHKREDTTFFKNKSSPEEHGTEKIKETGLPADGYVRRRLRTFSQDQTPKAL